MENKFIRVEEVADELGVSIPYAYKLIRILNSKLKEKGFLTIAGRVNLSVSEYIRQMIKKGRVTVKQEIIADVPAIKKIQAELGKIGSNLNQIARHFNSGGPYDAEIQWMLNRCTAALGDIKFEAESMAGDFRGYSQARLRKKR